MLLGYQNAMYGTLTNKFIKEERGNATICVGLSIKIKRDYAVDCKHQDGKLVHTVLNMDVEYMICETIPNNENEVSKRFTLKIETETADMVIKVRSTSLKASVTYSLDHEMTLLVGHIC